MAAPFTDEARLRLRAHFLNAPLEEHSGKWDDLWEKGDCLPWDRGLPNPALVDTLRDKTAIIGSPVESTPSGTRRKRALVPGCGKGYDVLLLSASGYDTIGLEVSPNALAACKKYAQENWAGYVSESEAQGKAQGTGTGTYSFILGDFFKDDWRETLSGFDLIYDYTFLCALPPEARPAWAKRQSELLAPNGNLICLEFPTAKPPSTGGPPHGLKPEIYVAHLSAPGETIPYTADGAPQPDTYSEEAQAKTGNGLALERLDHWRPERTHPVGMGTDFVSIWGHR